MHSSRVWWIIWNWEKGSEWKLWKKMKDLGKLQKCSQLRLPNFGCNVSLNAQNRWAQPASQKAKSHKPCIQQQRVKTPQPTKMQPNCVLHRLPHRGHFRCLDSVLLKSKQTIMLTVSQEKEVLNAFAWNPALWRLCFNPTLSAVPPVSPKISSAASRMRQNTWRHLNLETGNLLKLTRVSYANEVFSSKIN